MNDPAAELPYRSFWAEIGVHVVGGVLAGLVLLVIASFVMRRGTAPALPAPMV